MDEDGEGLARPAKDVVRIWVGLTEEEKAERCATCGGPRPRTRFGAWWGTSTGPGGAWHFCYCSEACWSATHEQNSREAWMRFHAGELRIP